MQQLIDITGNKYNRLTVLKFDHIGDQISYWTIERVCKNAKLIIDD